MREVRDRLRVPIQLAQDLSEYPDFLQRLSRRSEIRTLLYSIALQSRRRCGTIDFHLHPMIYFGLPPEVMIILRIWATVKRVRGFSDRVKMNQAAAAMGSCLSAQCGH